MPGSPNKTGHIYGTLANFKKEHPKRFLIRLGHLDDETAEPTDYTAAINAQLTSALQDAADMMDGYLMAKHATPVDPAPDFFERDNYTLGIMILLQRRGYDKDGLDGTMVDAGQRAEQKYKDLAAGKWDFGTPGTDGATVPGQKIRTYAPARMFSPATLDCMP